MVDLYDFLLNICINSLSLSAFFVPLIVMGIFALVLRVAHGKY